MSRLVTLLAVLLLCAFAVSDSTAHQFPWGDGTPTSGDLPDPNEDHPWGGDGVPSFGGEIYDGGSLDGSTSILRSTAVQAAQVQPYYWFPGAQSLSLWLQQKLTTLLFNDVSSSTSSSSATANDRVTR